MPFGWRGKNRSVHLLALASPLRKRLGRARTWAILWTMASGRTCAWGISLPRLGLACKEAVLPFAFTSICLRIFVTFRLGFKGNLSLLFFLLLLPGDSSKWRFACRTVTCCMESFESQTLLFHLLKCFIIIIITTISPCWIQMESISLLEICPRFFRGSGGLKQMEWWMCYYFFWAQGFNLSRLSIPGL